MTNEIFKKLTAEPKKAKKENPDCLTLSVQQAADLYGCSVGYIRAEIKKKNLKAATHCKNWRIDKDDFRRWYNQQMD